MGKFISDDEMEKMDAKTPRRGFISDDEMAAIEAPPERPWYSVSPEGTMNALKQWLPSIPHGDPNRPWYDVSAKGTGQAALNAIPAAAATAGGIVAGPIGAGAAGMAGESLRSTIDSAISGESPTRKDFYTGLGKAGLYSTAGQALAEAVPPMVESAGNTVGKSLAGKAESLAENATGATGVQATKFKDNAGRELLDRKLVRFGDSPANVAKRTSLAMDDANAAIDSSLKSLEAKGVTASADNVVSELQSKIAELKKDASQAGVVRKLESIVKDIEETGESNVPITLAEKTKRGFNQMSGNWMDPEVGQAGKGAYQAYRQEVENVAKSADPTIYEKFMEAKKTHGLLAPIKEAAERRASTVNQSPFGGLGDMAAAATGAATTGPIGAPLGMAAKKIIAPRVTSSLAVSADKVSKMLLQSPKLAALAESNPAAFQAMAESVSKRVSPSLKKVAGPGEQPVDEKDARQSFVEGN